MFETAAENWYYAIFSILMTVTFISWLGFARFSMARIEREMKKDGLLRSAAWDGVGLRVLWYVHAIALPVGDWNPANNPFIDVPTVRCYANRFDRILGMILFVSGNSWVIFIVVFGMILDVG